MKTPNVSWTGQRRRVWPSYLQVRGRWNWCPTYFKVKWMSGGNCGVIFGALDAPPISWEEFKWAFMEMCHPKLPSNLEGTRIWTSKIKISLSWWIWYQIHLVVEVCFSYGLDEREKIRRFILGLRYPLCQLVGTQMVNFFELFDHGGQYPNDGVGWEVKGWVSEKAQERVRMKVIRSGGTLGSFMPPNWGQTSLVAPTTSVQSTTNAFHQKTRSQGGQSSLDQGSSHQRCSKPQCSYCGRYHFGICYDKEGLVYVRPIGPFVEGVPSAGAGSSQWPVHPSHPQSEYTLASKAPSSSAGMSGTGRGGSGRW